MIPGVWRHWSNFCFFFFLIYSWIVHLSGKCQPLLYMGLKIGWTTKEPKKLVSKWRSHVKLSGFLRSVIRNNLGGNLPKKFFIFIFSWERLFLEPWMDYFKSEMLSFLSASSSFFSLICRPDILCSLKIEMDSIQLCCMPVGDFFHLTLIMNPFLKVWYQHRRSKVCFIFFTHVVWHIITEFHWSEDYLGKEKTLFARSLYNSYLFFLYTSYVFGSTLNLVTG